jgi:hypothetical protein
MVTRNEAKKIFFSSSMVSAAKNVLPSIVIR